MAFQKGKKKVLLKVLEMFPYTTRRMSLGSKVLPLNVKAHLRTRCMGCTSYILYKCAYTNCWFLSVLFSGLVCIERKKSDGEIEESPEARGVCRGHLDNDKPGTKAGEPTGTVQRVVRPLQPSPGADFSHHPVMIIQQPSSFTQSQRLLSQNISF